MAQKKPLPAYLTVLIFGAILVGIFLLILPTKDPITTESFPWNAHFDEQNQLHALGMILNKTTVDEAKALYSKHAEVKIFSQKDESEKTLEVYLPSLFIGSIEGAILLKVNISPEELNQAYNRGAATTVNQAGNREVKLADEDLATLGNRTFSTLTLIAKKNLTERAIEARFGTPERVEVQSDNIKHLFYPQKGLELLFDPEGPEALQFTAERL